MVYLLACFLSGYIASKAKTNTAHDKVIVCVVVVALGMAVTWIVTKLFMFFGSLVPLLVILLLVSIAVFAVSAYKRTKEDNGRVLYYLFGYFGIVLIFTIFYRIGADLSFVQVDPFYHLKSGTGSLDELPHFIMNIALFVPLGGLYSLAKKGEARVMESIFFGALLSSMVETIQLLFALGECDTGDVLSNLTGTIIGAIIGYFVWRKMSQTKHFNV